MRGGETTVEEFHGLLSALPMLETLMFEGGMDTEFLRILNRNYHLEILPSSVAWASKAAMWTRMDCLWC